MKLMVVDGNSIINRAFYGIKLLTAKDGQYTNAIQGFMNILLKLEQEEQPDEIAVAWDLRAPTFRHKMYDGYKAQRKGMPPELAGQMPLLQELLGYLGYRSVSCEDWEADDILGTLSKAAAERGDECRLVTGDRDSLQLIDAHTAVLLATTGASVYTDEAAVQEKYGVTPRQLIEVKSLMGDSSDNIPGVKGLGEKTALTLIQNFGSLQGVYENLDSGVIKPAMREKLKRDREQAEMSRTLAEICRDVPIDTAAGAYRRAPVQAQEASALLARLEMFKLREKLRLDAEPAQLGFALPDEAKPEAAVQKLSEFDGDSIYLYIAQQQAQPTLIGVSGSAVYCAPLYGGDSAALLRRAEVKKYCFDAKALYRAAPEMGITIQNIVFDAKLAAYLLNPSASEYSVEGLAASYGISGAFTCEQEAAAVLEPLCAELQQQVDERGMHELLCSIELPLSRVLADMEHSGILVDAEGIRRFGEVLQAEIDTRLAAIYQAVGYSFNVNSPKQLGKALFEDLGLPTGKKNKSGYSTNAEVLESLRAYSPVIDDILAYRTVQKLNSTYAEGLLKVVAEDGRIHSTFIQTETRTGRISSSEPNLQNIPVRTELGSQLRKFFIAKPGCVLLDADYSQIELRILAHMSGDETMRGAFCAGEDIHRSTAAKIYGLRPEEVTDAQRSSAKAVNFGIVYGIGAFSLSKDIHVSVKQADEFIKNYLTNFSGVKRYMDETVAKGRADGYVSTMYGRRRPLPELASSNFNIRSLGERMAMNTPIQGTAADIIKIAMIRVADRLQAEGLQAKLILQVHDELIVECPEAEAERAAAILGEEMQRAAELSVPLRADVHSGQSWYTAKG